MSDTPRLGPSYIEQLQARLIQGDSWETLTPEDKRDVILNQYPAEQWFEEPALPALAHFWTNPITWGHIKAVFKTIGGTPYDLEQAAKAYWKNAQPGLALTNGAAVTRPALPTPGDTDWEQQDVAPFTNSKGIVSANVTTIMAYLRNHPRWQGRFWWDALAMRPMVDAQEIQDTHLTQIARIFGQEHALPLANLRLLSECVLTCCHEDERDPLQQWLTDLPGWDGVSRLDGWLADCAGVTLTPYTAFVARTLFVSMVARAWEPGCLYRFVVILGGPEEYRKSSLIRALVPKKAWHDEMVSSFESKEAHMMLHGLWVVELAELDSLSRTEDTRLKAFISMPHDAYVPKYGRHRVSYPRRTIFIGTTNEGTYLKAQRGNTRFLPLEIGHPIDIETFSDIRDQLFAEAQVYYADHQHNWWDMDDEVKRLANEAREERRMASLYEDTLLEWLKTTRFEEAVAYEGREIPTQNETSWPEIAKYYLKLETPEKWKDINLQKQIAQALKAGGWKNRLIRKGTSVHRGWVYEPDLPF